MSGFSDVSDAFRFQGFEKPNTWVFAERRVRKAEVRPPLLHQFISNKNLAHNLSGVIQSYLLPLPRLSLST